jgi:hypothetical protein
MVLNQCAWRHLCRIFMTFGANKLHCAAQRENPTSWRHHRGFARQASILSVISSVNLASQLTCKFVKSIWINNDFVYYGSICRGEYAKLLGFIYAILLIIIGFLLSLTEAVTHKWLGTAANVVS